MQKIIDFLVKIMPYLFILTGISEFSSDASYAWFLIICGIVWIILRKRKQKKDYPSGTIETKVKGVTYKNDDGTDRQENLRRIYNEGVDNNKITIEEYTYNGQPAFHILVNKKCIGNVSADSVGSILSVKDKIKGYFLTVDNFENEDDETIYYARLTIVY